MKEMERYRQKIHGKTVVYVEPLDGKGFRLDAILIWEKNGNVLSVKPYGYTVDELVKILEPEGWCSRKQIEKPSFCFASLKLIETIHLPHRDAIHIAKSIAEIENDGDLDLNVILSGLDVGGSPECPYV